MHGYCGYSGQIDPDLIPNIFLDLLNIFCRSVDLAISLSPPPAYNIAQRTLVEKSGKKFLVLTRGYINMSVS